MGQGPYRQTTQTMGEGRVQECQVEAILDYQASKEDEPVWRKEMWLKYPEKWEVHTVVYSSTTIMLQI